MDVSLPSELAAFVEAKVKDGRFKSFSDVVHEALRLMEQSEKRDTEALSDLRGAWQAGLTSGEAEDVDFAALKAEGRARLAGSKA